MMETILIAGGGTMGKGLALCASQRGFPVIVLLRNPASVENTLRDLENALVNAVAKGKLAPGDKDAALRRMTVTATLPPPDGVTAVIEAIVEDMGEKKTFLAGLSRHFPAQTLLASTTSSLSITELFSKAEHPERCIGMHFFNPVPAMRLVEIIRGAHTSDDCHDLAMALSIALEKTAVTVMDSTGFVVSRLLVPFINDAAFLVGESASTPEDIDTAMVLGANHPVGPLALGDRIGLDVCLKVLEILYEDTRDSRYRPAPVLKKMVRAGFYGRKAGRGFFRYA